jgi:hypothetical protein
LEYITNNEECNEVRKNIKNFTNNELQLLDCLLETQMQFDLEKLNELYQKPCPNSLEMLLAREKAKFHFNVTTEKSKMIKQALITPSHPLLLAATIGKDMYSNSSSSSSISSLQRSTNEWCTMSF